MQKQVWVALVSGVLFWANAITATANNLPSSARSGANLTQARQKLLPAATAKKAVASPNRSSSTVGSTKANPPATVRPTMALRSSPTFGRAITARGPIVLNGNPVVDAFDSVLGPYDRVTNRFAAGNIATTSTATGAIRVGAATVFGTAETGPGGTVEVTSGAVGDINWCITSRGIEPGWSGDNMADSIGTNSPPTGIPFIPVTATSVGKSNITYLTVDSSSGVYEADTFTSGGSSEPLIVLGHCALFVTGDFTIHGSGYVYIAPGASLTLYLGGEADIAGLGVINPSGVAANFACIGLGTSTSIRYSGNAGFAGIINAPEADVVMNGSADGFGAIICNTYTANGGADFHYDLGLGRPFDPLVDSDGDGLTNLVEYAVGTDPFNPADANVGIVVWITEDNGSKYLAMKFRKRTDAAVLGLQYLPEVTGDRQTWYADDTHVVGLGTTAAAEAQFNWVSVRDTTPITVPAPRFIRLHIVQNTLESASEAWIGSGSLLQGNGGSGSKVSLFSFRMVSPVEYAGQVSSLGKATLTDTNAAWADGQFNGANGSFYIEFTNGWTADILGTWASNQSLTLADDLRPVVSIGDWYRIRKHFTIASVFGPTNSVGLHSCLNWAGADDILLPIPETQQVMTIFYCVAPYAGWYRADYSPAGGQVIYPEQGIMVRRKAAGDLNVYLLGLVKNGPTIAPVQRGYNLLGTLKSLANLKLSQLNLHTGDAGTGVASGLNPASADNVLVIEPNGSISTFFYYKGAIGSEGWYDAAYRPAGARLINAGSAFFVLRKAPSGPFNWLIPAE